jgi:RNA-directed DNA polymerase
LVGIVERAGFKVDHNKTRMQVYFHRQMVTGLTVNTKVNIRQEYYRYARSMCHSLFFSGIYHIPTQPEEVSDLDELSGILSYIQHVKSLSLDSDSENRVPGQRLYERFLFYRYFIIPHRPLIICEGKTDNIYLKYAIRYLDGFHPTLGVMTQNGFVAEVGFFNYNNKIHRILKLGGGSSDFIALMARYRQNVESYKHCPMPHPIILIMDNDDGLSKKRSSKYQGSL